MKKINFFLFILFFAVSVKSQDQNNILVDHGVDQKPIEDVLPGGQIVHIRINSLWNTLQDIESCALTSISKEMMPPKMRPILDNKNPLLEMLGMNTLGQAINPETLANVTGIDINKPLSLSIFPNQQSLFILSVPIKNFEAFSMMFTNIIRARKMIPIKGEGYSGTFISGLNPDLPKSFYVTCSKDYAYICGSEFLMQNIHKKNMPRMSASPIVKKSIAQNKDKDFLTVVDMQFIKLFSRSLKRYEKIPPQLLSSSRQNINTLMTPQVRLRLMWQFGITDMNKALDYFESFLNAGYETAFQYLYERINNFDGFNIACNVGELQQGLSISVFSKDISKPFSTLKMDKMAELLTSIPGDRNSFSLQAQTAKAMKDNTEKIFLGKLKLNFTERNLDMKVYSLFENFFTKSQPVQALSSQVPWSIRFPYNDVSIQNAPINLEESAKYLFTRLTSDSEMRVLKTTGANFVDHYTNEAETLNANDRAFSELKKEFDMDSSYILHENRVLQSKSSGMDYLILESAYKTKDLGLFGYDEHEFINRRFFYYKKIEDFLFVESRKGGKWLNETDKLQKRPLNKAVLNLLNQVPKNATSVQINRTLQDIDQLLTGLSMLENGLRAEVDQYLQEVNIIMASKKNSNEKMAEIETLPMPLSVLSLNLDEQSNKCNARLLGKLEYPRPVLMDKVTPLFDEYLKTKDNFGGSLVYENQEEGQYNVHLIQRTDGITNLLKTTIQSFLKTHSPASFKKSVTGPTDGYLDRESILIVNPTWDWTLNF